MDTSEDYSVDSACERLQNILQSQFGNPAESTLHELLNDALVVLTELKKLSRMGHTSTRSGRLAAQEAKQSMDEVYLQLQNYRYEALHLAKEIAQCEEMELVAGPRNGE